MPILHACVHLDDETGRPCGVHVVGDYRCPEHKTIYERDRLERNPWRRLYTHPAWFKIRPFIWRRDEARCTFEIDGRRCNTTALLEVHHEIKLRDLWKRYGGDWPRFVKAATDPRILRLLCPEHHKIVDDKLDEFGRFRPAVIKPPPLPPRPRRRRRERRRHQLLEPIESLLT